MKYCNKCKRNLETISFARNRSKKDGLASTCKECNISAQKKYYSKNSEYYKNRSAILKKNIREKIRSLKAGSPCLDCGVRYPSYVMQFDHISNNKNFSIGNADRLGISEQVVLKEIDKCELVCANCHCQRTHDRLLKSNQH
jgi:hypothetical protein